MRQGILSVTMALLACAGASGAWAQNGGPVTVAVVPFVAQGVDEAKAFAVEQALRDEISRLPASVQDRSETIAHIEGGKSMGLTCKPADTLCLVEIGKLAGVSKIVTGAISPRGATLDARLTLIDVAGTRVEQVVLETTSGAREVLGADMRRAAVRLFKPEDYAGALVVEVDQPGATILVDGVAQGSSPLTDPVAGLSPGRHQLEVRLPGHRSHSAFADVRFGETTRVAVVMEPMEGVMETGSDELATTEVMTGAPPEEPDAVSSMLPMFMLWGGAGAAGIGVLTAGAGAALITALNAYTMSGKQESLGDVYARELALRYIGLGMMIGGGALFVVGGAAAGASFLVE